MSKPKLRWKFQSSGFRQILTSGGTQAMIRSIGARVAAKAGPGFERREIRGGFGGGRVIGFVSSTTRQAREAEATDKVLSKAIN